MLVVGAGPIGLMATAVVRHAGARYVVVSEPNAFRREIAIADGRDARRRPARADLAGRPGELGMVEGFDVVLEMSGNPAALRDALANMAHGAGMAILGIPTEEVPLDLSPVIFKQLTLRGIYGREMYETWYKMTVMLQSGLDISPAITHRFSFRDHEAAFAAARSGDSGKVIMDWSGRDDGMTQIRTDPLAFLGDELDDLREQHLYRPLRVMASAQGPIVVVDGAEVISLSSNDYLGLTHHPRLREAALAAVRDFGAGSGAVRTIAGTMDAPRGAGARARGVQGHRGRPDVPERLHGQHRRDPDDHRRAGPDRLGRAQPRLDHRRDAALEGAAQDLPARRRRRAARGPPRGARARAATAPASPTG